MALASRAERGGVGWEAGGMKGKEFHWHILEQVVTAEERRRKAFRVFLSNLWKVVLTGASTVPRFRDYEVHKDYAKITTPL